VPRLTISSNASIVRRGLERLRAALPTISRKRLYDAAMEIQARMSIEGTLPKYPIHWDSDLQRRAFFRSKGFGGGIPTTRTSKYIRGWKVERADSGYTVVNNTPRAKFIGGSAAGTGQSQIHVGRWRLFRDQADFVRKSLPKLVRDNLREFIKRTFAPTHTMGR